MTLDEIQRRIETLEQQINELAAQLPEDARISFGTRFDTSPGTPGNASRHRQRKRLVIKVNRA